MRNFSTFCVLLSWIMVMPPAYATDDLCPQDSAAVKNVPGDVAGVQADIDRLNLCVERAKLLKQLDDIAKQRSDTLNKVKDPLGSSMMNSFSGGVSGIAPLPLNALPELPAIKPSDLKPGEIRVNKSSGLPLGGDSDSGSTENSSVKKGGWKIRKIWGQPGGVSGATMRAQISDSGGNLMNVAKGDPLPDGSVVDSVSIKGVTLTQKGPKGISKVDNLSWDDVADSSSSNPSATPDTGDKLTP